MSGPFAFSRRMMAVDDMLRAAPSWEALEKLVAPSVNLDGFRPDDTVQRFLGAMAGEPTGRAVLEWLADLTVRAGPGHSGDSFEAAAIAHAKLEARFAIGQAIFRAAAEGVELLNQREPAR